MVVSKAALSSRRGAARCPASCSRCAAYCCVRPHLRADEVVRVRRRLRRRARKGHALGQGEQPQPTTAWWVGGGAARAVSGWLERVLCALPLGLCAAQLSLWRAKSCPCQCSVGRRRPLERLSQRSQDHQGALNRRACRQHHRNARRRAPCAPPPRLPRCAHPPAAGSVRSDAVD